MPQLREREFDKHSEGAPLNLLPPHFHLQIVSSSDPRSDGNAEDPHAIVPKHTHTHSQWMAVSVNHSNEEHSTRTGEVCVCVCVSCHVQMCLSCVGLQNNTSLPIYSGTPRFIFGGSRVFQKALFSYIYMATAHATPIAKSCQEFAWCNCLIKNWICTYNLTKNNVKGEVHKPHSKQPSCL